MFASVFVHQKTNSGRSFDYEIPPEISVVKNQLVEVPFGTRKILGIVEDLKLVSRLAKKKIIRTLSSGPILTLWQKKLATELSEHYQADLNDILTSFLPVLNKRDYLKLGANIRLKVRKLKLHKSLLIGSKDSRLTYYLQKLDRSSQNLIILPTIYQIEDVEKKIRKMRPEIKSLIWHSKLDSAKKAYIWQKILDGENLLILGTRHALFLPFTNLKELIIDDPLNFAYQDDQSPYYNAYPVTRILSAITQSNLIVGEDAPDIISYSALLKNKLELIEIKSSLKISLSGVFNKAIQNIDFQNKISLAIACGARVAVIGPWRDQIRLVCRDCKNEIVCQKCRNARFSDRSHNCILCGSFPQMICPKCQSVEIDAIGFSYKNIIEQIRGFFPESIDKITARIPLLNEKQIAILSPNDIDTLKPSIDYFIFPFFDFMANSPGLGARQKLFRLVRQLSAFSPKEVFLFGENLNDSDFISQAVTNNWRAFLQSELRERRKLNLPPFTQAVLAVSRAKDKVLSQKHLDQFISQLPKSVPVFPHDSNYLFLVNYKFDFSVLSLPSSVHLEIDRGDLV